MFGKNKTTTNGVANTKKYKPYRNRPSVRQAGLEILSFLLILAGAPAFLGGVISIFIAWVALGLGLIGLFAWTRRHAFLFALVSACLVAICIINIILRATWNAQCLPFYNYNGVLNNPGTNGVAITNNGQNNDYNNSIWCGNNYVVYITNGIICALALAAHVIALMLLFKRKTQPVAAYNNGQTTTTRTVETKEYVTA